MSESSHAPMFVREMGLSARFAIYLLAGLFLAALDSHPSISVANLLDAHVPERLQQLEGGIEAWEEPTATGPREFHLKFIRGDEAPVGGVGVGGSPARGIEGGEADGVISELV